MTQDDRLKGILKHINEHGKIRVEEICECFGVSRDTARRDLVRLEDGKFIVRTHGGAMAASFARYVPQYDQRFENRSAKQEIGQMAATLIREGEHILMDSSTTVQYAAEALAVSGTVVLTNSLDVAAVLGKKEGTSVHLLGGEYNAWNRNITGGVTVEMVRKYRVQTLFLGACGLTVEGLSSPLMEEACLKRTMLERAERVIVLADSSKFNRAFFHHVCGLKEIDILITDKEPPAILQEVLLKYNIQVLLTKGGENIDT